MKKRKEKKKKIDTLLDLGVLMEITRSTLGLPDTDERETIGIKGLRKQIEIAKTRFPDKKQIMLFYCDIEPNLNYNPEDEEDAPINVIMKKVWINKETNKVVSEPRWWKKIKENQPFPQKDDKTSTST